jgi:uncharacterized peroxidase-related enzyme
VDGIGFLAKPETTVPAQRMFDEDIADVGYVMNLTRMWARQPAVYRGFEELLKTTVQTNGLTVRQRGILVAACASTLGDSYCALAWGGKLAAATDADFAAGVLRGDDSALTAAEQVMAAWARKVASDPNGTTAADVQELRDAGFDDDQIFGITVYLGIRIMFSTINDALGARPDAALRDGAPAAVLEAITFGRPVDEGSLAADR